MPCLSWMPMNCLVFLWCMYSCRLYLFWRTFALSVGLSAKETQSMMTMRMKRTRKRKLMRKKRRKRFRCRPESAEIHVRLRNWRLIWRRLPHWQRLLKRRRHRMTGSIWTLELPWIWRLTRKRLPGQNRR